MQCPKFINYCIELFDTYTTKVHTEATDTTIPGWLYSRRCAQIISKSFVPCNCWWPVTYTVINIWQTSIYSQYIITRLLCISRMRSLNCIPDTSPAFICFNISSIILWYILCSTNRLHSLSANLKSALRFQVWLASIGAPFRNGCLVFTQHFCQPLVWVLGYSQHYLQSVYIFLCHTLL